jgi:hypothetical protein
MPLEGGEGRDFDDAELLRLGYAWQASVVDMELLAGTSDCWRLEDAIDAMGTLRLEIEAQPCYTVEGAKLNLRVALQYIKGLLQPATLDWEPPPSYQLLQDALLLLSAGNLAAALQKLASARSLAEKDGSLDETVRPLEAVESAFQAISSAANRMLKGTTQGATARTNLDDFNDDSVGFLRRFMEGLGYGLYIGSDRLSKRFLEDYPDFQGRVSRGELCKLFDKARGFKLKPHRPPGVPQRPKPK